MPIDRRSDKDTGRSECKTPTNHGNTTGPRQDKKTQKHHTNLSATAGTDTHGPKAISFCDCSRSLLMHATSAEACRRCGTRLRFQSAHTFAAPSVRAPHDQLLCMFWLLCVAVALSRCLSFFRDGRTDWRRKRNSRKDAEWNTALAGRLACSCCILCCGLYNYLLVS